ncbi:hypothetical protein BASA81_011055 [Batrachochytrium salamandrivorans]|nr:hypothetical protein BASA81_011055 [Batrachochytrium salamandrivorans]
MPSAPMSWSRIREGFPLWTSAVTINKNKCRATLPLSDLTSSGFVPGWQSWVLTKWKVWMGSNLGALAVHLRAKGLDKLRFHSCGFDDEILAAIGVELGRIKKLMISRHLDDASIELIALALQSPNNEMKELVLDYAASSIETHLVPALKHPNCNLAKLSLFVHGSEHKEAAKAVEDTLRDRLALFALLQGRQPRRRDAKRPEAQRLWVGGGSSLPRRTSRTPPSSYSPSIGIDTRGSELDLLGTLGFGACISAGVDKVGESDCESFWRDAQCGLFPTRFTKGHGVALDAIASYGVKAALLPCH